MELMTDFLSWTSRPDVLATAQSATVDDTPQQVTFDDVLRVPGAESPEQRNGPPPDCRSDAIKTKAPVAADSNGAAGGNGGTTESSIAAEAPGNEAVAADEGGEPGDDRRGDAGGEETVVIAPHPVLCDLPPHQVEQDVVPSEAMDPIEKPGATAESAIPSAAANRIALAVQLQGRLADATAVPPGEIVLPQKQVPEEIAAVVSIPIQGARDEPRGQRHRAVIASELRSDAFSVAAAAVDSATAESARSTTVEETGAATTMTEPPAGSNQLSPHDAPQPMVGSRLVPELLTAVPGRPTRESEPPPVDVARLLHRVARAFLAAHNGEGEISLRLSPPELGALRLEVKVHEGAIVAHVQTETATARTALIDNLPALRERLAEQGIRIERFDVDLMQHQGGGASDRPANREPQPTPARVQTRERRLPQVAEGVIARTALTADFDQRRLNVIV